MTLKIEHVNTVEEAQRFLALGYEPVECSISGVSVISEDLAMDHHGTESWRDGVAVRAYREHFGARKNDPRFVVTGAADADAAFCIAALAGILPHPSREAEFATAPLETKVKMTRDLSYLAALINQMDTAPIGVRLTDVPDGDLLLLFDQLSPETHGAIEFYGAVDRWRVLLTRPLVSLRKAAHQQEAERVASVRNATTWPITDEVSIVESELWGFDVWYTELSPVILQFDQKGSVTVGCVNKETAERLLGAGGLMNIFAKLEPKGWGGREAIGGSPRGEKLTLNHALTAARTIARAIRSK